MKTKKVEVNTGKVKVKRRKMEVNMMAGSCDSTIALQVAWMENMVKKMTVKTRKVKVDIMAGSWNTRALQVAWMEDTVKK